MTEPSLALVQHIRGLVGPGPVAEEDEHLVARFAHAREQDAFVELMRRHGPMVFGVCQRVLGNRHDAEDVFQAVFLVLARKASSLRSRSSVASWLCRVAYHVALRAGAQASRRREREKAVAKSLGETGAAADQEEWQAIHDELEALPERFHAPVVLCYLEGQTYEEAARQLRWPLGTLKKRLTRARDLLRRRLLARGLGLAAALLAAPVAESALASCPAPMEIPSAATSAARTLAEEVMRAMFMTRLKVGAVLVLTVGVLLAGAALMARPGPSTALPVRGIPTLRFAPAPQVPLRQRVLLAASGATRDFQFLRSLLARGEEKKQTKLAVYLQMDRAKVPPGTLKRFPDLLRPVNYRGTKEEEKPYNLNEYDLIVAFDVDWSRLSPETLELLKSWVDKGGGLILVAGPSHTAALGKADAEERGLRPILRLCPVTPSDSPQKKVPDEPRRLRFAKEAPDLPFLKLDPEGKGPRAGWEAFYTGDEAKAGKGGKPERGFYGYQPGKARKGTQVLLNWHDAGDKQEVPWLAVRSSGKGRVVWLGSGEVWRLRAYREAYHERFWLELARYAGAGAAPTAPVPKR
jgi:RNA polymerase sigma factor (sigma-70 family)